MSNNIKHEVSNNVKQFRKMASKKYLELQDFSLEELRDQLTDTQAQYTSMKFDHAISGLDNPMKLREMRRDVARVQSEIRRREIAEMTPEQLANRSKIRARRRRK